eukprot:scaffold3.g6718.t1
MAVPSAAASGPPPPSATAAAVRPEFVALAHELADAAAAVTTRYFRTRVPVDVKADASPVTIADREAEAAMRALISARCPDHAIFGEEAGFSAAASSSSNSDGSGGSGTDAGGGGGASGYLWVIDPIDGTKSFITGKPLFGTLIALLHDGVPVLGVIDQPVLRERWLGVAGQRTTLNGAPIATRPCPDAASVYLYATTPHMFEGPSEVAFNRLRDAVRISLYGCDCYAYGLLAAGCCDLVAEADLKPYDYMALVPVIEGAGGVITDWRGEPLRWVPEAAGAGGHACPGEVLAAGDARAHAAALKLLAWRDHHGEWDGPGHAHGPAANPANPIHRCLKAAYDATRLTPLAAWLESSAFSSVAKVLLLLAAAAAAWASGRGGAGAALASRAAGAATAGVYLFAGVPAAVDLSYDLTAGRVDTHVLMNLAVVGTLVTGYALEGALLLVLFQTSHALEHLLTHKAQGNLAALYEAVPSAATLVRLGPDGGPDMTSAARVLASEVAVGSLMLVKPGEQVPLDGEVVHGRALVSAEHITGEALPVLKRCGDDLAAGSLNRDGVLVVRASRLAAESTPARIAKMTLDAQATRPRLRSWLDAFGEAYSKAVIAATVLLLVALLASGVPLLGAAGQRGAFYRAMGLLTVASPCALGRLPHAALALACAPTSFAAAAPLARPGRRRGVLLKGGRVLDALSSCTTVAFDKTGTLTTGSLQWTSFRPLDASLPERAAAAPLGSSDGEGSEDGTGGAADGGARGALEAAVALSLRSTHPVSEAVVVHGEALGVAAAAVGVSDFVLVAGGGVEATLTFPSSGSGSQGNGASDGGGGGQQPQQQQWHAAFGSVEYVASRLAPAEAAAVERLGSGTAGTGVVSVLVLEPAAASSSSRVGLGSSSSSSAGLGGSDTDGRRVWVATFEDSVRKQSSAAVGALQTGSWAGHASPAHSVDVLMLTGDNEANAARVAAKLGISNVLAGLTPAQKLQQVEARRSDGAAARRARGWAAPRRRGGVVMVGDGINDAPALAAADVGVAVAATTSAASLAADAVVVSASGIAAVPFLLAVARDTQAVIVQNLVLAFGSIAALALPTVLGFVPLWLAVMLHEGSTLLVALNSLRLLRHVAAPGHGAAAGGGRAGVAARQCSKQDRQPAAAALAAAA